MNSQQDKNFNYLQHALGLLGEDGISTARDKYDYPPYDGEDLIIMAIAVQSYEYDNSLITEVGVAIIDTDDTQAVSPGPGGKWWIGELVSRHYIVTENEHLVNRDIVKSCSWAYEYGTSSYWPLETLRHRLQETMECPRAMLRDHDEREVVLVGHGLDNQIDLLSKIGIDIHKQTNILRKIDTQKLCCHPGRLPGLSTLLEALDLGRGIRLHNAGNDAHLALSALLRLVCFKTFSPWDLEVRLRNLMTPPPVPVPNVSNALMPRPPSSLLQMVQQTLPSHPTTVHSRTENAEVRIVVRPPPAGSTTSRQNNAKRDGWREVSFARVYRVRDQGR